MEKSVARKLQVNIDLVVAMPCRDVRINVQDAAGDRILAGDLLDRQDTNWMAWNRELNYARSGVKEYQQLHAEDTGRLTEQEEDHHVGHALMEARKNPRRKFPKGPKLKRGESYDSCRLFGSLEGNRVQGDFHITARGHGYLEFGDHLEHSSTCQCEQRSRLW